MTWFVVFLCGCTDCFPHAAFAEKDKAEIWAKENSHNPEGYLIEEMSGQKLAELDDS